jgi:predicted unusual protein kinase regulating ubiquinone biosynthesis (AarF/ABC1/UbiB family)
LVVQFYENEDMQNVDYELVQHITDDIQDVMRQQPIQLPSEFIFLGRAVSTFIGVLYGLNPQIDIMEVGKPIITDWLSKNGGETAKEGGSTVSGIWKTVQKYGLDIGRQLLKLPRQVSESLEEPRRRREWDKVKQKNQFLHEVYTARKRYAFLTALTGLLVAGVGYYLTDSYLLWGGGVLALVSVVWYRSNAVKHIRWIEDLR